MSCFKALGSAAVAVVLLASVTVQPAMASQPKFEPEGGTFPVTFTGVGGAVLLETQNAGGVVRTATCSGNSSVGEINTATTMKNVTFKFTGCTATGPFGTNWTCTSSGAKSGEIATVALEGTLYYLKAGSSEAGVDFLVKGGGTVAAFTCVGVFLNETFTVSKDAVGKLTPMNSLTNAFSLTFAQTGGHQEPSTYLNAVCSATADNLSMSGSGAETFGGIGTGLSATESLTTAKKVKVNSTQCT
jgi:hypothetical protein